MRIFILLHDGGLMVKIYCCNIRDKASRIHLHIGMDYGTAMLADVEATMNAASLVPYITAIDLNHKPAIVQ